MDSKELGSLVVVVVRCVGCMFFFQTQHGWFEHVSSKKCWGKSGAGARTVFFAVPGEGLDEDCLDLIC